MADEHQPIVPSGADALRKEAQRIRDEAAGIERGTQAAGPPADVGAAEAARARRSAARDALIGKAEQSAAAAEADVGASQAEITRMRRQAARAELTGKRLQGAASQREKLVQEYIDLQQRADAIRAYQAGSDPALIDRLRATAPPEYNLSATLRAQQQALVAQIGGENLNGRGARNVLSRAQAAADEARKRVQADVRTQKSLFPPPTAPRQPAGVRIPGMAPRLFDASQASYRTLDELRANPNVQLNLLPEVEAALAQRPSKRSDLEEAIRQQRLLQGIGRSKIAVNPALAKDDPARRQAEATNAEIEAKKLLRRAQNVGELGHIIGVRADELDPFEQALAKAPNNEQSLQRIRTLRQAFEQSGETVGGEGTIEAFRQIDAARRARAQIDPEALRMARERPAGNAPSVAEIISQYRHAGVLPDVGEPNARERFYGVDKQSGLPRGDVHLFTQRDAQGRIIGAAEVHAPYPSNTPPRVEGQPNWQAFTSAVGVDPAHRRQGIGSDLLRRAYDAGLDVHAPESETYTPEGAAMMLKLQRGLAAPPAAPDPEVEQVRRAVEKQVFERDRRSPANLASMLRRWENGGAGRNVVAGEQNAWGHLQTIQDKLLPGADEKTAARYRDLAQRAAKVFGSDRIKAIADSMGAAEQASAEAQQGAARITGLRVRRNDAGSYGVEDKTGGIHAGPYPTRAEAEQARKQVASGQRVTSVVESATQQRTPPPPPGTELIRHPTEFGRPQPEPDYWTADLQRMVERNVAARQVDQNAPMGNLAEYRQRLAGRADDLADLRKWAAQQKTSGAAEADAAATAQAEAIAVQRVRERSPLQPRSAGGGGRDVVAEMTRLEREAEAASERSANTQQRAGRTKAAAAERAAEAIERQNAALRDAADAAQGEVRAAELIGLKAKAAQEAATAVEGQNAAMRAAGTTPVGQPRPTLSEAQSGADKEPTPRPDVTDEAKEYAANAPGDYKPVTIPHNLEQDTIANRLQSRANAAYLGQYSRAIQQEARDAVDAAAAVEGLGRAQAEAAREANFSAVAADANSRSWRKYGAMTTEFIDAARKGQASYREWGAQIGQTAAKFAGWTLVSIPVFAALDAVRQVGTGAIQSSSGVATLQRTIDNVDASRAQQQFRDLSKQFNMPVGDVAEAVGRMGQVFHNQDDAVRAATAALYSYRTGGVDVETSTKNLIAITNGFGLSANDLMRVFDQLNQAQNRFGATIPDTEAGLAKAAGAFRNAGGDVDHLIALIVTAQRVTGRSGNELGTAFARSAGFIRRPSNQATLRQFGIDPTAGIQQVYEQAFQVAQGMQGEQLNRLATALSSPQYARIFVPLLQSYQRYQRILQGTSPGAAQNSAANELHRILGGVDEQIKALGNGLERLGSNLAQSGLLDGFGLVLKTLNEMLTVVNDLLGVFNRLPEPVRSLASNLAVGAAGVSLMRRANVGERFEGTRLAGLGGFLSERPEAYARRQLNTALDAHMKALQVNMEKASSDRINAAITRNVALQRRADAVAQYGGSDDPEHVSRLAAAGRADVAAREAYYVAVEREEAINLQIEELERRNTAIRERINKQRMTVAEATAGLEIYGMAGRDRPAAPERPMPIGGVGTAPRAPGGFGVAGTPENPIFVPRSYLEEQATAAAEQESVGVIAQRQSRALAQLRARMAVNAASFRPGGMDAFASGPLAYAVAGGQEIRDAGGRAIEQTTAFVRNANGEQAALRARMVTLRQSATGAATALAGMFDPLTIGLMVGFGVSEIIHNAADSLAKTNDQLAKATATPANARQRQQQINQLRELAKAPDTFGEKQDYSLNPITDIGLITGWWGTSAGDRRRAAAAGALDLQQKTQQRRIREIAGLSESGDAIIIQPTSDNIKEAASNAFARFKANSNHVEAVANLNRDVNFILRSIAHSDLSAKTKQALADAVVDEQIGRGLPDTALLDRFGAESEKAMDTAIQNLGQLAATGRATGKQVRDYFTRVGYRINQLRGRNDPASQLELAQLQDAPFQALAQGAQANMDRAMALSVNAPDQRHAIRQAISRYEQRATATPQQSAANRRLQHSAQLELDRVTSRMRRAQDRDPLRGLDAKQAQLALRDMTPDERRTHDELVREIEGYQQQEGSLRKKIRQYGAGVNKAAADAARVMARQKAYETWTPISDAISAADALLQPAGVARLRFELAHTNERLAAALKAYGRTSTTYQNLLQQAREQQQQIVQQDLSDYDAHTDLLAARAGRGGNTTAENAERIRRLRGRLAQMHREDPHGRVFTQGDYDQINAQIIGLQDQSSQSAVDAINAKYQLLESVVDPGNAAKIAQLEAQRAAEVVRKGGLHGPQLQQAQADANRTRIAAMQAAQSQFVDQIEFQASIGRITAEGERAQLQHFLDTHKKLRQTNRQLYQSVMQTIHGIDQQDAGQFDVNPANIRLPSITEIRHTIQGGAAGVTHNQTTNVNVTVNGAGDHRQLVRQIERQVTGALRSAARSGGTR